MLPTGSTVTFDVQGATARWFAVPRSEYEVRSSVIAGLSSYFDVSNVVIRRQTFLTDPLNYLVGWPYSSEVTLTTRSDYGGTEDVARVVGHAFYEAGGQLPTVTARGTGVQQDVALIGGIGPPKHEPGAIGGLFDTIGTTLSGITNSLGVIGLGAIALGAVVLIVAAKNR